MKTRQRSGFGLDQSGFTLIETLVSVVIVALLSFGLFRIFTTTNNTYQRGTENIDGQQNARASLNWIAKELRGAKGFNLIQPDRVSFLSDVNTNNQVRTFMLDTADQDGDGDTSELLLVRSPRDDGTPGVAVDEIAVGVDSLAFIYRGGDGNVVASRAAVQEVEIFLFATGNSMREEDRDESYQTRQVGMSTRVRCRNLGKSVPTGGDVTPPANPTGLSVVMGCGTATAGWTANAEDDIAGYYLFYSAGSSGAPYDGIDADQGASPIFVGTSTSYTLTGLDLSDTYYFNLQTVDAADNVSSYGAEVSGVPSDASPPGTPANLTGRVVGNTEIQLSWSPSADWDVSHYLVVWYDDVDPMTVHQDSTTSLALVLTGLNANAVHTCSVAAVDACGNQSPLSSEITITMIPCDQDVTFPEIPATFQATPGDEFVRLIWDPVPDTDVVGYQVFFKETGGAGSTLLVGNVTEYSVYGLENNESYLFQVAALDGCGHLGGYTGLVSATPQNCASNVDPPDAPLNVAAWDLGVGDQVKLSWTGVPDADVLGYRLHVGTAPGIYGSSYDLGNDVFFTMAGLLAGTEYYFALTAYDVCGNESAYSAAASAIPTWGCACPPTVSITTPGNFDILEGTVDWFASASACSGDAVDQVQFEIDGATRYVDYSAPFEFGDFGSGWMTTMESNGQHTLVAVAVDANGCETSDTLNVYVDNSGLGVSCVGIEDHAVAQVSGFYNEVLSIPLTNFSRIDTYHMDAMKLEWDSGILFPYLVTIDGATVWSYADWPQYVSGDSIPFWSTATFAPEQESVMEVWWWDYPGASPPNIDLSTLNLQATFYGSPLAECGAYDVALAADCDLAVVIESVNSARPYDVILDAQIGQEYYTDRGYTLTYLPAEVEGATLVRTPNDDKNLGNSHELNLEFPTPVTVYVAYDPRGNPPDWIENEFVNDGLTVGVTDGGTPTLGLWRKNFDAGIHTFSGNKAQGWGGTVGTSYVIFVTCQ